MQLIRGVDVEVSRHVRTGTDRYGAPVYSTSTETVAGVLPQPGACADLDASRPEGARVDMTFHFPKGRAGGLKGATVSYGGRSYRVVGDPRPYAAPNVPGPWDTPVECEAVDG